MKFKGKELDMVAGLERLWGMEYNGMVAMFQDAGWTHKDIGRILGLHVTTIAGKVNGRLRVKRGDVFAMERLCQIYRVGMYAVAKDSEGGES
jgi:hypothetical protein